MIMLITFEDEMKWGGVIEFKKHITYSLKDLMINRKASQQKINEKLI